MHLHTDGETAMFISTDASKRRTNSESRLSVDRRFSVITEYVSVQIIQPSALFPDGASTVTQVSLNNAKQTFRCSDVFLLPAR